MNKSKFMWLYNPAAQEEYPKVLYDKTEDDVWTKSAIKRILLACYAPKRKAGPIVFRHLLGIFVERLI